MLPSFSVKFIQIEHTMYKTTTRFAYYAWNNDILRGKLNDDKLRAYLLPKGVLPIIEMRSTVRQGDMLLRLIFV